MYARRNDGSAAARARKSRRDRDRRARLACDGLPQSCPRRKQGRNNVENKRHRIGPWPPSLKVQPDAPQRGIKALLTHHPLVFFGLVAPGVDFDGRPRFTLRYSPRFSRGLFSEALLHNFAQKAARRAVQIFEVKLKDRNAVMQFFIRMEGPHAEQPRVISMRSRREKFSIRFTN